MSNPKDNIQPPNIPVMVNIEGKSFLLYPNDTSGDNNLPPPKKSPTVDDLEKLQADLKDKMSEVKENVNRDLRQSLSENLTLLSIFGLILTFISINVNLFSKIENLFQGIIFFILFSWCLITIVYFIFQLKDKNPKQYKIFLIPFISLIILFCGAIYSYKNVDGFTFKKEKDTSEIKTIEYKYFEDKVCPNI